MNPYSYKFHIGYCVDSQHDYEDYQKYMRDKYASQLGNAIGEHKPWIVEEAEFGTTKCLDLYVFTKEELTEFLKSRGCR